MGISVDIQLGEQYGSVYTLYLGQKPVVILCGYGVVKEALIDHGEEFGARGDLPAIDKITKGYGLGFSNGERWRLMRNFTLKTLRNFGMGKKSIEGKIQEEVQCLVEEFRKSAEHPLDPAKMITDAISNILFSIVFGNRFEYKDEKFSKLLAIVEETLRIMNSTWGQLLNTFPNLMAYIPGPHHKITALSGELITFISEKVMANQETLDPNYPRDFIDSFLIKMEQEKQNPNTEFNMQNLLMVIHSLFIAGIETVSSTLRQGILILLYQPEIQDKLHEEIDQVIGRNRIPNIGDLSNMPYTEAVLNEMHRFSDITPLNVPRMATKDIQFRGYSLPQGTIIYPILCAVLHDPTQFSTPRKFNPNHFLDEDGKFKKSDAMMAFSAGKRICLGESLARVQLFLFLTTILQNFTLTSQTKFTESDITPRINGIFNFPIHYQLSFISR
ncbi:cytochrome P450 2G1-like [Rhinophrynus dorsalis]